MSSSMRSIKDLVTEHPFFDGMDPEHVAFIAGCASNAAFKAGQYIFQEGAPADNFYLIREGRAAVEIHAPGRGGLVIQTVEPGEILGWSWLFPPYKWVFDARAVEPLRALALDGKCLRGKAEQNKAMGYELMKRFSLIIARRLEAARVQLLDVYGPARKAE